MPDFQITAATKIGMLQLCELLPKIEQGSTGELHSALTEAGISKIYCTTKSCSPVVELRFCLWITLFKY
jgi:hypothetical protein